MGDDYSDNTDYGGGLGQSQGDYEKELQRRNLDPSLIAERMFQKYQRPQLESWRSGGAKNVQQLVAALSYGPEGLTPEMAAERAFRTFTPSSQWYRDGGLGQKGQSVLGQEPPAPPKGGGQKSTMTPKTGEGLLYPTLRQKNRWAEGGTERVGG
ncbi:MAG: hypothetical protein HQK60_01775, partial [Deltaproteobacteria bacterium]|nr:hypothetical protein [Deltaproteobacteria bacterium]